MGIGGAADDAHIPVLLRETLAGLQLEPGQTVVDCTFGRGGHTRGMLAELGSDGRVVGLDRDPQAVAVGEALAADDARFTMIHAPFSALEQVLANLGVTAVDRILLDLGVSSPQLDVAARGFSFAHDGPLDMRMDPTRGHSAADWVNGTDEADMARVFKEFGEERFARRVARSIAVRRVEKLFATTLDLASTIAAAMPKHERHKHPATRCFQAIRIAVNEELDELREVLGAALRCLRSGGRMAVISFHSLEERVVKRFMREQHLGPELPRGLPPPPDWPTPPLGRVMKAVKPGNKEVSDNPRARSAVLRVAEAR